MLTFSDWVDKHIFPSNPFCTSDDLEEKKASLGISPPLTTNDAVEQFDRMTRRGWKLNFVTGEYYR